MMPLLNGKAFRDYSANLAEITISYKNKVSPRCLPQVRSSEDTVKYLRAIWSEDIGRIEEFISIYLNTANKVLGWAVIGRGGIQGTVADKRIIIQLALLSNASGIILAHNHPSGNSKPSYNDKVLTAGIKNVGDFHDIKVLDHIILTPDEYLSFADEGFI